MKTLIERHHQHREHRDYPELSVLIHQLFLPRIDPFLFVHRGLLLLLWSSGGGTGVGGLTGSSGGPGEGACAPPAVRPQASEPSASSIKYGYLVFSGGSTYPISLNA